ncbi:hypothetical protein [Prolixibacter denitrificans]|nr:hypothetical protein [Prolixibacter denitrificans]PSK85257.1 hypothetical protein CLV93_101209 [Prolixibacter denitrificans]
MDSKQIIETDEKSINFVLTSIQSDINSLNKGIIGLLVEDGITPTAELVSRIINEGVEVIRNVLLERCDKDIKRLKIRSKTIEESMRNDARQLADRYQTAVYSINNAFARTSGSINQMTGQTYSTQQAFAVENGKAVILEDFRQQVEQDFTYEVKSKNQADLWEMLGRFAESYNQVNKAAERAGIMPVMVDDFGSGFRLKNDSDEIEPDPRVLNLV